MDLAEDRPVAPAATAATRTTDGRQRVLAALVVVAAALLVYSLSGGPWARATIGTTQVELRLSGQVQASPGGDALAEDLDLSSATGGATRDLTQVLAVLVLVVAAVGLVVDLRSRLWGLLTSASLVCLLAAAVLRDGAASALGASATALDARPAAVGPTGWSGLAIGAAAAAALASFLATAERGVAARPAPPVLDHDPDPATLDPTPPGAPGPAAPPPRLRSTPAGRVRARLLNSLPSRER